MRETYINSTLLCHLPHIKPCDGCDGVTISAPKWLGVEKHRRSGSATAAIRIREKGDRLTIEVRDNGKGIPLQKQNKLIESNQGGVGFGGMRERLTKAPRWQLGDSL